MTTPLLIPPPRYRPAILPEQRRMLVDTVLKTLPIVFRDFMTNGKQQILHPDIIRATEGPTIAQAADFMARHEAYRLKHASLYYVAPDMTALAISAGRALPDYEFTAADLPSPYGFLVFDGPYPEVYDEPWVLTGDGVEVPAHLTAVAWGPITDPGSDGVMRHGVWVTYYSDRDASDEAAIERGIVTRTEVIDRLAQYGGAQFVYDNESMIFEGSSWQEIADEWGGSTTAQTHQPDPRRPRVGPQTLRTLLAASLLMREPLARTTSEPEEIFTRPERRRMHREGLTDEVRVVHLRQAERAVPAGDGESHGREYTCQWPVVGHWRRQWYPSEGRHRPRYIAPYVKGDPSKPLRVRETVRVWDR